MSRNDKRITLHGDRPRIVVIRLGAMGDCIYTFPLVSALKAQFPHADVTWIVEAQNQDIPRLHPGVNDVIVVDTKRWRQDIRRGRLGRVMREIGAMRTSSRAKAFDVALDSQGSIKSGAIAWLTGAPVRVGFARGACREGMNILFTTHRAELVPDGHIVRKNLSLLDPFDIRPQSPGFTIHPSREEEARAQSLLDQAGVGPDDRVVGVHPGTGHSRKQWNPDRYAQVGDALQGRNGLRVILTEGPGEDTLVRQVASQMRTAAVVIPPLRVGELAALLARYDLFIAGDTGPLHLAAAVGCPTVAIYGPSDPVRVAPVGDGHRILKKPCACGWEPGIYFNRGCVDVPCLGAITAEEVVAVARSLLELPTTVP